MHQKIDTEKKTQKNTVHTVERVSPGYLDSLSRVHTGMKPHHCPCSISVYHTMNNWSPIQTSFFFSSFYSVSVFFIKLQVFWTEQYYEDLLKVCKICFIFCNQQMFIKLCSTSFFEEAILGFRDADVLFLVFFHLTFLSCRPVFNPGVLSQDVLQTKTTEKLRRHIWLGDTWIISSIRVNDKEECTRW